MYRLIFIFCFLPFIVSAQQISDRAIIKGTVIDNKTKEAIPFVTIKYSNKQKGTISNSEGTYKLTVEKSELKDSIVFSAIGYKSAAFLIQDIKGTYNIKLKPISYNINEVVIKKNDPVEIIKTAISKIEDNYPQKYYQLKGIYRELIKENNEYVKMTEAACRFQLTPYNPEFTSEEEFKNANLNFVNSGQSSQFEM